VWLQILQRAGRGRLDVVKHTHIIITITGQRM
jgi:hypothetical protein